MVKNSGRNEATNVWKRTREGLSLKFQGINLDSRLTFADHIRKMEEKCKKVINVLRCLRGREWGASRLSLKRIYVALIRSVLGYGNVVFGSAATSQLKK